MLNQKLADPRDRFMGRLSDAGFALWVERENCSICMELTLEELKTLISNLQQEVADYEYKR